ncbi:MAG: hemolysin family protein [Candidatus Palauibacterales bacterium]|nr:hemolysin family protein [Candidatus Palauibacterales bacterium]MDP2528506.1 hemolysin family protein [Candidatus Palauibacterales bacterium]MDP2584025.1 hemolysin family protein [Candidatus Palauibacterales bacterium]
MDPALAFKLLAVLLLVGANGFFVAAEFALVKARRTRMQELAEGGDLLARAVQAAQANLDRSISGTQLGITIASIGLGWIGEPAIADTLSGLFARLPGPWSGIATHGVAVAIAFALITFLHIVLGELAPKTAALLRPETVSRYVAVPLNLFNRVTAPAVWLLNSSAGLVVRAFGWGSAGGEEHIHSPEEIQMLLHQSLEGGVVEQDEEAMIHGVFELTRTVAREVMTPRTDIVAVRHDASLDEVLAAAADSGFSRLPVYRESIDDVVGVVLVKDLLPWLRRQDRSGFRADRAAREAYFVPDTKPVDDLLAELRRHKVHMAVVVDEFGGTDGIVTLEDLVEEIVGDIYDEHDIAQAEIRVELDGRILVDGGAALSDLEEEFDLPEVGEEYDTVAGYVIGELGHIPEPGERVPLGPAVLEVLETRDRRVTRLELHETGPGSAPGDTSPSGARPGGDGGRDGTIAK